MTNARISKEHAKSNDICLKESDLIIDILIFVICQFCLPIVANMLKLSLCKVILFYKENGSMSRDKGFRVVLIVGTRPEGIKMAPVYHALKRAGIATVLCSTMQHHQLLEEVFELFQMPPDIRLNIMRPGQDLFYLTQAILQKTKEMFLSVQPSLVLVQGDTTSTMAASLAAFYLGIPVGHIEAGLRTHDVQLPFPEEMNRRFVSLIARYHFAPTSTSVAHLLAQGIASDFIFCTGNTIVDALHMIREKINQGNITIRSDIKERVTLANQEGMDIGLLTVHRRESLNGSIESILHTVKKWVLDHPHTYWFYPYHPNPMVVNAIRTVGLRNIPNFYLCEPLGYKELVYILDRATFILTDSGGIQEEAVSLSKPVLVLRDKTERMEGVFIGNARIVGADPDAINQGMAWAASFRSHRAPGIANIYGDGHAAEKIVAFIQAHHDQWVHEVRDGSVQDYVAIEQKKKDEFVKKVCVVGLGYIGLPTAIVAAESGYNVIGYDTDAKRVAEINSGNPVIHEPEAYEKLQFVLGLNNFKANTTIEAADYFVVAVPTPITQEKKANIDYVFQAAESIAIVLKKGNVVIIESTIPVGVTEKIALWLTEKTGFKAGSDFFVAHCPERVLPGNIFYELVANDRIIGGINKESVHAAKQFYKPFVSGRLFLTNASTAEMVKLVENSSRDAQLAFAHQVGSMAQSIGLNPYEVIALANKHPRVNILRPTCGVGGHCIAVDPWFLVESFPKHTSLIKAVREVNDQKPHEVITIINQAIETWRIDNIGRCKLLLLGVSYKPNVEDLRESPALAIAKIMQQDATIDLMITDPHVDRTILYNVFDNRITNLIDGLSQADIVAFLVAHDRFKLIDRSLLDGKKILDFCGVLYEPVQQMGDEHMYWPAQNIMDFFIVNQNHNGSTEMS
jgi:UDP-N-acetylglucosamine 2-epimerase (non-hydrolysing)